MLTRYTWLILKRVYAFGQEIRIRKLDEIVLSVFGLKLLAIPAVVWLLYTRVFPIDPLWAAVLISIILSVLVLALMIAKLAPEAVG